MLNNPFLAGSNEEESRVSRFSRLVLAIAVIGWCIGSLVFLASDWFNGNKNSMKPLDEKHRRMLYPEGFEPQIR